MGDEIQINEGLLTEEIRKGVFLLQDRTWDAGDLCARILQLVRDHSTTVAGEKDKLEQLLAKAHRVRDLQAQYYKADAIRKKKMLPECRAEESNLDRIIGYYLRNGYDIERFKPKPPPGQNTLFQ